MEPNNKIVKKYLTYNDVHLLIAKMANEINKWKPDFMVAIGGGGFIPARILRTFIATPILAVCIKLYDDSSGQREESPRKLQWLDGLCLEKIKGKKVLIVDEVDDTRATLSYCVPELQKCLVGEIGVFVLQNKLKKKHAELPKEIRYYSAENVEDAWIVYPWEAEDIKTHDSLATSAVKSF